MRSCARVPESAVIRLQNPIPMAMRFLRVQVSASLPRGMPKIA